MAKEEKSKVVLERTYNVPLRKEFLKVPKYKKAKKAITALRKFISKHMKSDQVRIGKHLNELVWAKGMQNPPHHVQISCAKEESGVVRVEMIGKPIYETETPKKERKAPAAKSIEAPVVAEEKTEEAALEAEAPKAKTEEQADAEPKKKAAKPKKAPAKKAKQ
jgi:large subunit ribosomal protein L31e